MKSTNPEQFPDELAGRKSYSSETLPTHHLEKIPKITAPTRKAPDVIKLPPEEQKLISPWLATRKNPRGTDPGRASINNE